MALFLITSLIDEGIYDSRFQVIEANSKLEIAAHMISNSWQWERFLRNSAPSDWRGGGVNYGTLLDYCVRQSDITPERLLELIDMTRVDGDSDAQLAIHEISPISLQTVNVNY
jgi:hypothetical protein